MAVTNGVGGRISMWRRASRIARFAATVGVVAGRPAPIAAQELQSRVATQNLPARLSDSVFWGLVTTTSEPGGYFRSDNFVSNETSYQWVIPELLRTTKTGGVYLGEIGRAHV